MSRPGPYQLPTEALGGELKFHKPNDERTSISLEITFKMSTDLTLPLDQDGSGKESSPLSMIGGILGQETMK